MTYQDRWNGTDTVSKGYRECVNRYHTIASVLQTLTTPFTLLDVGAAEGYFAARIVNEFPSSVTAVESRPIRGLPRHDNLKWINAHAGPKDIAALGAFDAALALSLLHHMNDWREMFTALRRAARHSLIVETPHPEEQLKIAVARRHLGEIDVMIRDAGGIRIGDAPGVWDKTLMRGIYRVAGNAITEER